MESNNLPETDKHQVKWPQIIIMFMAIGSFFWTLRNQSRWLLIVPICFILLSLVLLVRDSGPYKRLVKGYRLKKKNKKERRETKKYYPRFVLLVEKSCLFRNLMDYLDRTEWNNKENYPYLRNISFVNWHNDILQTAKGLKIRNSDEMKLISQRFKDFLDAYNAHYLETFSTAYKLGQAKYPNEDIKKQIVQLKRRYDNFLDEYNDFCKEVNSKCANSVLAPVYCLPPDLDWAKGDKP